MSELLHRSWDATVERDRAWQAANTQYPGYAAYQQRTQRGIPVMMLDPEE
jgi:hypothetical protein